MHIFEIHIIPKFKLDIDNKVYIVYDENGNEYSRYKFQHVWDSSSAKRAAEKDVNILKIQQRNRQSERDAAAAEARPLSKSEDRYYRLDISSKKYLRALFPKTPEDKEKYSFLDDETKKIYSDTVIKWMEEMNRLADSGSIRKSLIQGTYKPSH